MKPAISFETFKNLMSSQISKWDDDRNSEKIKISLYDVTMSAFACMFYQSPSLLQFQRELQNARKLNNLLLQFGVKQIPSNTQLKDVLDVIDSNKFVEVFNKIHKKLLKYNIIKRYENKLNTYFLSIDGTQFYTSTKVKCKKCLISNRDDVKHYSHKMLQSAIVAPGKRTVIPLMPIEISNELGKDIHAKQDCERKSFARNLKAIKKTCLNNLPFTILLDALYATQPDVKLIRENNWDFIIVSKPNDNKYLHEEFELATTKKEYFTYEDKKYIHEYKWSHDLPLTSTCKTNVNIIYYCMKSKKDPKQKTVYKNSWITSHIITKDNVKDLVLGGRARWKIENECFNNLKNQGYHLEHSYGHGENSLSFNFIVLTMLAFYIHQLLEEQDELFIACRKFHGSKMHLWQTLKSYIKILLFESFEILLRFSLDSESYLKEDVIGSNEFKLAQARAGPM